MPVFLEYVIEGLNTQQYRNQQSILLKESRPQYLTNVKPRARNSTAIMTKFGRHVRIDLGMVPTETNWPHEWPGRVGSLGPSFETRQLVRAWHFTFSRYTAKL